MASLSMPRLFRVFLLLASFVALVAGTSAQDGLSTARDLYRAASYDEALAALDKLRAAPLSGDDAPLVEQYRALCLLALGRPDDAQRAMEAAVALAPAFRPSTEEAPPAVRATFREVRRRLLPRIIEQKYAEAKAAFDRRESAAAAKGFTQVVDLLADADIATAASQPPLSNLRALAVDFRNLSDAASAPPPTPPPARVVTPPPPPPPPAPPAALRIYGPEDTNVVPPVTLRQVLPPVGDVFALRQGVVEIIIDETGAVQAATMRVAVNPVYDRLVLSAAKTWRYRAALLDGKSVKFRKLVQIDIKPR
jgi:tetratricopeptide (TPR) repeat protein